MTLIDLVLDTGELVRIECRDKDQDALYDTLEYAMKRRDWWSPMQFDGCSCMFLGMHLNRVSMARVVALL